MSKIYGLISAAMCSSIVLCYSALGVFAFIEMARKGVLETSWIIMIAFSAPIAFLFLHQARRGFRIIKGEVIIEPSDSLISAILYHLGILSSLASFALALLSIAALITTMIEKPEPSESGAGILSAFGLAFSMCLIVAGVGLVELFKKHQEPTKAAVAPIRTKVPNKTKGASVVIIENRDS